MKGIMLIITVIMVTISNVNFNNELMLQPSIQADNIELGAISMKNDIKYIYSAENKNAFEVVSKYIEELPLNVRTGLKEVYFEKKKGEVAGVAKGNAIILYDFMSYDKETQKHILFHEIGHIFANELSRDNNSNYDYEEYIEVVKKDNNYLSNYSKNKILENNNYSEDFADAFSMYFSNNYKLKKRHKNRYKYLKNLIKSEI